MEKVQVDRMKLILKMMVVLSSIVCVSCFSSKEAGPPLESDYYQLDGPKCETAFIDLSRYALKEMSGGGTGDRNLQKKALQRVADHGIYSVFFLMLVLEEGNPYQRQVCKEALLSLVKGQSEVLYKGKDKEEKRIVDNRRILAGFFLNQLEREYDELSNRSWRSDRMKVENKSPNPINVRRLYRLQLCELMGKVGSVEYVERLLLAVKNVKYDSPVVKSQAYHAAGIIGGENVVPTLIKLYQDEESKMVTMAIWETLQKLTGMDYPNYPALWKEWGKRKGYDL